MAYLGNYQIVLIVLLVLNFIFWVLIICWRMFLNKSEFRQNPIRRLRRRGLRGHHNPVNTTDENEHTTNDLPSYPYIISNQVILEELPPSYDEALKLPEVMLTQEQHQMTSWPQQPVGNESCMSYIPDLESLHPRRHSNDAQDLVFCDNNGNPIDVRTIPVESQQILVFDTEHNLEEKEAAA